MTLDVETLQLHGLKVLDFSRVLAGPFCGAMLADAGVEVEVEVVKIEPEGTSQILQIVIARAIGSERGLRVA